MTITDQRKVYAYPFGPHDRLVLDPMYARLREDEPVARVKMPYGDESWLVTRHADAQTVLVDPRFSRAAGMVRDVPRVGPQKAEGGTMAMDPPEHTRLRRLAANAFTPRRVEQSRPTVEKLANELVDEMVKSDRSADLVDAFALPIPIRVICEMLGVPYDDQSLFRTGSEAIISTTMSPEEIFGHINQMMGYMAGMVAQRRSEPSDDLLGALVRARDEEDQLSEEELVLLGVGLLTGGFETTSTQIANSVYVLQTQPEQLALLRQRPELIPDAVDELLRWIPLFATATFARFATEPVELTGVVVPAGDPVLVSFPAANRDGRVFSDPEKFDITRGRTGHLAFGHGIHHCMGAPLARLELEVALETLLRRLPDLRFAVPEPEIPWKAGSLMRGPKRLPVTW